MMASDIKVPRAFISYSTKDKRFGGAVKQALDELKIESFLAHNDLAVSDEWQKRILRELAQCNVFVPLLSANFIESEWCSQESGIASRKRGVLIVPLSLDGQMPYGFIRHVQGQPVRLSDITAELFIEPLISRFPRTVVPPMIDRLKRAYSFRGAEAIIEPIVPFFRAFDRKEANNFAKHCIKNGQIWSAQLCREEYLPEFLKVQGKNLTATNKRMLAYQVKNQRPYEARK